MSGTRAPLIRGNLIDRNNTGMNSGSRSLKDGTMSGNTFSNNNFDGFQGGPLNFLIFGNRFVGNHRSGMAFTSFGNTTAGRGAQFCTVTCNTFTGNGFLPPAAEGLFLSTSQPVGSMATNVFHNNNIFANNRGATYNGTEAINAENNWWGAASGPTHAGNPGGTGDTIVNASGSFDYTPFLTAQAGPTITCPASITVSCAMSGGTVVTFTTTATDPNDPSPTIDCSPASGSLFPVGTTNVCCTATNAEGCQSSCCFNVTVQDTISPVITCPNPISAECSSQSGTPITFTVTAMDACDPAPTIVCTPASGSAFPLGGTTVSCTATDHSGNMATCSFVVTINDTMPPTITCPASSTVQCNTPGGRIVTFSPTATDVCDGSLTIVCTPPSGSLFPVGVTTTVNCTATDDAMNSASCSFTIRVVDSTSPQIDCPLFPIVTECTSPAGATVTYTVTTTDSCDASPTLVCMPPSGATFPIATTTVSCTSTDHSGNFSTCSFNVTVADTTAPALSCPSDFTAECDSPAGKIVTYAVTATDACDASPTLTCSPLSGTNFSFGTTQVCCTATDDTGNSSSCCFRVTVVDTTPPTLTCPAEVTVGCGQLKDPPATGTATATDLCGPPVVISFTDDRSGLTGCNATGVILRTWSARDATGNTSTCVQRITVVDTDPPTLTACPPNTTVDTAPGVCNAVVSYTAPTATDKCYSEGFENPDFRSGNFVDTPSTDWNDFDSHLTRVPSGTNGVPSRTGGFHGLVDSTTLPPSPDDFTGIFARLGGYTTAFGTGFTSSIDVYMNLSDPNVLNNTYGWDCSTAASTQTNAHRRDFIFHTASNALGQILVAGSNNSNFTRRNDLASINHYTITSTGWYHFEWVFRDNGSGALAVDLNLYDSLGTHLFTETRSDPSDLIATIVGGNRYMWFTFLEVDHLAIDNTCLSRNAPVTCSPASGSTFPLGGTAVTCSSTDLCGNAASCSFTVTVVDNQNPTITCPANITTECTGPSGTPVTFTATAADNCPGVTFVCSPASGSSFALTTTTVSCTATDAASRTATCSFSVTIVDTTPPSVTCPANIVRECTGPAGAVVTFAPTATDICDPSPIVSCTPPSGSTFPIATTTVVCSATDHSGNGAFCSFTVTVRDTVVPSITCPADVTRECTSPAGAVATYASATATDLCDTTPTVACAPASGSTFPIGSNAVTCTATDDSGNFSTCTFHVIVRDTVSPVIGACPANITRECTGPSGATATFTSPTATDVCDTTPTVACVPASGSTFPIAVTTVTCTATDDGGNSSSCTFTVTIRDTVAPTITCPSAITQQCTNNTGGVVTFTPTTSDLCDSTPTITCNPPSGSTFPFGSTNVVCTATDDSGNVSTPCSFTVTVVDTTAPALTCSPNLTRECTSPSGAAVTFTVTATDACDPSPTVTCAPSSGSTFAIGTTTVNCTARDNRANQSTCSFTVTVRDTVAPTINCPANCTAECQSPSGAVVSYTVTATDTCDTTVPVTCTPASGSTFALGATTVTCSATDDSSNTRTCSFMVTVSDTQGPVVSCPANITRECTGTTGAAVTFTATANDACQGPRPVTCVPASGSTFPIGTTTVTCSSTDTGSHTGTCSFSVTVRDTTSPTITCPSNVTADCQNSGGAIVTFNVSATDVCDSTATIVCSPSSGSLFPIGMTTVTCVAVDDSSNSSSCSFSVSVGDVTISAVFPSDGSEAGGDVIKIQGCNFTTIPDTTVLFGAASATVLAVSSSQMTVRTPAGTGVVGVTVTNSNGSGTLPTAYSYLDPVLAARRGQVNVCRGQRANVLFINSSIGDPVRRELTVHYQQPISGNIIAPPGRAASQFVMYAWRRPANTGPGLANLTPQILGPNNFGVMALPTPVSGGSPQPLKRWNNCCNPIDFGTPNLPSSAAPSVLFSRAGGLRVSLTAVFQGFIIDDGANNAFGLSITNAVVLFIVP
ncbi:MAG: HYR domain-containing protein [Planctomycetes bacterium]|nr:HYR domain-containing protein [Planctomycetota bacterium]